jgi:hypothetical protein
MPLQAVRAFETLIDKVVAQGNRWNLLDISRATSVDRAAVLPRAGPNPI